MGLFDKISKSKTKRSSTTIIAPGTKINGIVDAESVFHVDGELEGEIRSTGVVTIGRTGTIRGHLKAKKLMVTGVFSGKADCDEIEILAGGNVSGEIASKVLVVERGSHFEGESNLKGIQTDTSSLQKDNDKKKS
ncbi:MAG: polymer-forming cytoskeletal protein [Magnetococcales bacterium]|nr:polymer-forming cytoskeletal protein [Magnetococcales bacterium]